MLGDEAALEIAMNAGPDLEETGADGCTALHHAARVDQDTILRALIARGANVRATDGNGRAPYALAQTSKENAEARRRILALLAEHEGAPEERREAAPTLPANP